jgi:predicted MFS family arabinose efflux permease
MVDLALFRNPRFTAAAGAIMVLFFGLGGSTFVLTQIFQFVLGYSPLAAGVRSLPMAAALTIAAPLGTRLAARLGIRTTVTAGLVIAAAGLGMAGLANGHTGYPYYMIVSVLMSSGIGLTMAPATQSIMTSLPPAKVGVGSAVNNTTRNLGTVLGVAVVGSIAATAYTNTMATVPGVPAPARHSIGAASEIAGQMPGTGLRTVAAHAFVHGAALGSLVAAAVVLAMAVATARFLSR